MTKTAVVIGAGMGGLATALRLRKQGFEVELVEKGPRAGGRSNLIQDSGFRVDTGPTILVMKGAIEETYRALGTDLGQRVPMVRLDPNYRLYFHDGRTLALSGEMAEMTQELEQFEAGAGSAFFEFLGDGARKYDLGMEFVERNYDRLTDLINPKAGWRMLKTRALQNLYSQVSGYFDSPSLRRAFTFHSMFLGLSPYRAPAMYSLITYADLAHGVWFPLGGMYRIVEDMVALAGEFGVRIHYEEPVEQILVQEGRAVGVRTSAGREIKADIVVSNADLPYTVGQLLEPRYRTEFSKLTNGRTTYSCSGFLLYLGLDRTYPNLDHQNLYFAQDYRGNLDDIFDHGRLPEEPSFHLSVPTVTDPSLARPDHSLLYVLAPMPNLQADIDWEQAAPMVREQLMDQLERIVGPDLRAHIVWERQFAPPDFAAQYNAVHGTAFGSLSHEFFQSSFFRPHNKSRSVEGLYFVGQGTYPGIGVPMVHISARLVVERIVQEWS